MKWPLTLSQNQYLASASTTQTLTFCPSLNVHGFNPPDKSKVQLRDIPISAPAFIVVVASYSKFVFNPKFWASLMIVNAHNNPTNVNIRFIPFLCSNNFASDSLPNFCCYIFLFIQISNRLQNYNYY